MIDLDQIEYPVENCTSICVNGDIAANVKGLENNVDNNGEEVAISEVKKFLMDSQYAIEYPARYSLDNLHQTYERVSVERLNCTWLDNSSANIDWVLDEILNLTPKSTTFEEKSSDANHSSTPINQAWIDESFSYFRLSPILKQINNETELAAIAAKFLSDSQEEFSCMNITEINCEDYAIQSKSTPNNSKLNATKKPATDTKTALYVDESIKDEILSELPIYCEKCACIIPEDVLKCSGCRNCYHRACCTESNMSEIAEENSQTLPNRWRCERCNRFTVYASKTTIFKTNMPSSTTPRVLMGSEDRPKVKPKKYEKAANGENGLPDKRKENSNIIEPRAPSDVCLFCRKNSADFTETAYCSSKCLKKVLDKLHDTFNNDQDARIVLLDCQTRKLIAGYSAPKLKNITTYLETHKRLFPRVFLPEEEYTTEKPSKKKKMSEKVSQKTTATPPVVENPLSSAVFASTDVPKSNDTSVVNKPIEPSKPTKADKEKPKNRDQKKKTGQQPLQSVNSSYKIDHVRILVRQHLRDCLFDRLKHCDDILLSKDELNPIAIDIEKAMFVANKEEVHSAPYKQQFKALLVNLKEQNNQGFFRRILNGTLSPHKVATMSGQEMASRENSQWTLPGSKASSLECTDNASTSKFENSSIVDTSEKSTEKANSVGESQKTSADDVVASTFAEISNNAGPTEKSYKSQVKRRIEDTTMEHKSHLFDLNCKVCAGKMTKQQYLQLISAAKRPKTNVVQNSTNNQPVNEIAPQQRPPDYYQHHRRSMDYEENVERHSVPIQIRNSQPTTPENVPFARPSSSTDNFKPTSSSSRPVLLSPPTLIFAPVDDADLNFGHSTILNADSFVQPSPPPIVRRAPVTSPMRNASPFVAVNAGGQRLLPPVARIPPIQNNLPTTPVLSAEMSPKIGSEWRQMTPSSSSSSSSSSATTTQIGIIRMPPVFDSTTVFVQGNESGLMSLPPPPMPPPVPDYLKDGHDSKSTTKPADPSSSPRKIPLEEPSSIEPSPPLFDEYVWRGVLDMPGYYRFSSAFVGVSGSFEFLSRELPHHLRIVGRITKETVYDYVKNLKGDNTKDVVVVRLIEPCDIQQKAQYHGLLGNMVLKEKFSVVETSKFNRVKDLYLLPLQRNEQPADVLLPFDGPGLPNPRSEMIMAIIVRRRERIEHVDNEKLLRID